MFFHIYAFGNVLSVWAGVTTCFMSSISVRLCLKCVGRL